MIIFSFEITFFSMLFISRSFSHLYQLFPDHMIDCINAYKTKFYREVTPAYSKNKLIAVLILTWRTYWKRSK